MKGLFFAGAMIAATLIGLSAFAIAAPFSPTVQVVQRQYDSPALVALAAGTTVRVNASGNLTVDDVRRVRRGARLTVRDCHGVRLRMSTRDATFLVRRGVLRVRVFGSDALDPDCIEVEHAIGVLG